MESSKEASTSMATNCYLDNDERGKKVEETRYRAMIGSLLYLMASKPDIMLFVFLCARFESCPKELQNI
jgi:hypothetical protein